MADGEEPGRPEVDGDLETLTESLELVRGAQRGDAEALDRLFGRYYGRVRRVVRVRLGQKLRGALESGDILQETFAVAVRCFDRFEMRDEASLINWLSKLAERQIIAAADYHSAKKRDRGREVGLRAPEGSSEFRYEHSADTPLPDEIAANEEEAELVEACLDELDEDYRELLVLRHWVGASWETIAEATGRPTPDAARMMHTRAMTELGKKLRERGARRD